MPGFETINTKELNQVRKIFNKGGGVLFRQGFENLRSNSFQVNQFEKNFAKKFNSKYALAVSSGTAALRIALAALGISKNDEVITQSFTFVATVEAIVESGAKPICTEIDDTLNMCPRDLIKKITKKTKAIILVHMLGSPGKISEIKRICKKKKIFLIEDTAWGIGGKYKNKFLGTVGEIGTFSFDFAKTVTTGEGGMLLFKNKNYFLKAKAWHDHGHENNPKVPRWEDTRSSSGFNYRMTELQAALGLSQMKRLDEFVSKRHELQQRYDSLLEGFPLLTPFQDKDSYSSLHLYPIQIDLNKASKTRKEIYNELRDMGIGINVHYIPIHTQPYFVQFGFQKGDFPISEKYYDKAISIPLFHFMTIKQQNFIISALDKILN